MKIENEDVSIEFISKNKKEYNVNFMNNIFKKIKEEKERNFNKIRNRKM